MAVASESTAGLARERWDSDSGSPQAHLTVVFSTAVITDTDQPAAEQFLSASTRFKRLIDLSGMRQARLVAYVTTAGTAGSLLKAKYIATDTGAAVVGSYLQLGTASVQVSAGVSATLVNSGWIDLATGAKGDVVLSLTTSGGDATADPVFGHIELQFR